MLKYDELDGGKNRLNHADWVAAIKFERLLEGHNLPEKSQVDPTDREWVNFDLMTYISSGLDRLSAVTSELAAMLGGRKVMKQTVNGRQRFSVQRPKKHQVDLLDLLEEAPNTSSGTAILGVESNGRAVSLNMASADNHRLIVAGNHNAGKTSLVRTILLSLAVANRQSEVQMAIVAGAGSRQFRGTRPVGLKMLSYLPHMLFSVVEEPDDTRELITFLVEEAEYRLAQGIRLPLLIVVFDDVDALVQEARREVREGLIQLFELGPAAGIRTILTARDPQNEALYPLIRNALPVRIIGTMDDAASAKAMAATHQSGVEYLRRQGEFVAVAQGRPVHFKAAFIDDSDLHWTLSSMHRQSKPVLLARKLDVDVDNGRTLADHGQQAGFGHGVEGESTPSGGEPESVSSVDEDIARDWQAEIWPDLEEGAGPDDDYDWEYRVGIPDHDDGRD